MKAFFRFFAERHILATLITVMIIMVGLKTIVEIKRDTYPKVDFGMMVIVTRYPGASPEDVELNVTNKIEDQLKSVTGIQSMSSVSMENVSLIRVMIDIDAADQDKIRTSIREAVGRVTDLPPEATESPTIEEPSSTDQPVIEVGLSGDVPYHELRERARMFEKKLKGIWGVSRLTRYGYRARQVKVEVSPAAVERFQIPMREVIAAIQRRNIRATTGSFESYTSEKNLVALAQFKDVHEVGDVIVRSTFEGPLVKVKDLAIISNDFEDERLLSRINGRSTISFLVYINESADVIRTTDRIKEFVASENEKLPETVRAVYSNDTSRNVRNSFDVVLSNAWMGLFLVIAILPFFFNFRTALWVAMGIPVAMMGTIFLLPLFGMYLDTITLTGMVLVLGMIVDDAIVISENIARRREMGDSPLDAATNGIYEVFWPVVGTVLTTIIVFVPMFFMPGVFGKYIVPIPLAITLALLVSLMEATVCLPSHIAADLQKQQATSTTRAWFRTVRNGYERILRRLLRFRYALVVLFFVLLLASLWYAATYIKFIMFPSAMAEHFFVGVELPIGTPLHTTSEKIRVLETMVSELPKDEVSSFTTRIGTNPFIGAETENYGALSVNLTPHTERSRTADEIVEELRSKTNALQGYGTVSYMVVTGGPPVGKPVSLQIIGADDALRTRLADSIQAFLGRLPGVKDITRDDKAGKEQVEIKINYESLARLGLTVADVAQNVRIAYDGEIVTSLRYGDEDIDFRVMVEAKARRQLSYLNTLLIPNRQGRLIPLADVASLRPGPGKSDVRHIEGERTITLEADVEQTVTTPLEVNQAVRDQFNVDRDWPGMRIGTGGEIFETEKSVAGLFRTLIIAVVGVYFLLVLLFNSMTQPFLVMMAIPFGITGVILAFAFHGEPFSFVAVMGMVGMTGVVVNDSIVLVDFLNTLRRRKSDGSFVDLVAEGTAERLRPIILTNVTTIAALLPLAYGLGGTAAFMAPMALALGWGLLFAMPLTLVLIPSLYLIGIDMGNVVQKIRKRGNTLQTNKETIA